jgi:hypothetical protein
MGFFFKKLLDAAARGSMRRAASFAAKQGVPRDFSRSLLSEVTQITQYAKFLGKQDSEFRGYDVYKQYGFALQLMYEKYLSGETTSLKEKKHRETQLVDNKNGTVTDTTTGLMWQQAETGTKKTWKEAIDYCKALGLAGHNDWRLPDLNELESIVDTHYHDPCIDRTKFPGAMSSGYWSSNTNAINPDYAWNVYFNHCIVCNGYKLHKFYYMRAVRGGKGDFKKNETFAIDYCYEDENRLDNTVKEKIPNQLEEEIELINNNDGTLTGSTTDLMWQEVDDGIVKTWEEAIGYCKNLNLAGYNDWRLPKQEELMSIVYMYSGNKPKIDERQQENPYYSNLKYWSSTPHETSSRRVWVVELEEGNVESFDMYWKCQVRAVRDHCT